MIERRFSLWKQGDLTLLMKEVIFIQDRFVTSKKTADWTRGAGATGAAGATAPTAQTVRGQHGGNRLLFLSELHFEIRSLFSGI